MKRTSLFLTVREQRRDRSVYLISVRRCDPLCSRLETNSAQSTGHSTRQCSCHSSTAYLCTQENGKWKIYSSPLMWTSRPDVVFLSIRWLFRDKLRHKGASWQRQMIGNQKQTDKSIKTIGATVREKTRMPFSCVWITAGADDTNIWLLINEKAFLRFIHPLL